jgi:hypothetical protein
MGDSFFSVNIAFEKECPLFSLCLQPPSDLVGVGGSPRPAPIDRPLLKVSFAQMQDGNGSDGG